MADQIAPDRLGHSQLDESLFELAYAWAEDLLEGEAGGEDIVLSPKVVVDVIRLLMDNMMEQVDSREAKYDFDGDGRSC